MAWPKGVPRKKVESEPVSGKAVGTVPGPAVIAPDELRATNIKAESDTFDKKLSYFQYDDSASYYEWERENPLEVPKEIRDANPHLEFRYRALDKSTGNLNRGKDYHGWQVYQSGKHPEGLKVGGDLVLSAMPKERAESYRKWVQERSSSQVRDIQETQIATLDRAAAELGDVGYSSFQPGYQHETGRGTSYPTGVVVGVSKSRDKKTGRVIEQYRGYHPEQVKEMAAKTAENRAKGRKYSYSGQTKRS